jgi:hypothetical protein
MELFLTHPDYPEKLNNVIDVAIKKNKINPVYFELQLIKSNQNTDNIQQSSRILLSWTFEVAPCISSVFLCLHASYSDCSKISLKGASFFPIQLLVVLSTFCRFSIPRTFWLCNLVAMFSRASGTIVDSSSHVCSHLYASRLQVME